jgi:hypothetical protein
MPTPAQSRSVDVTRMIRKLPGQGPVAIATPVLPQVPAHLIQSTVMISSLPAISTVVDGITRQFYGARGLPTRRGYLP